MSANLRDAVLGGAVACGLLVPACASPDQALVLGESPSVVVYPDPIPLERGEGCTDTEVGLAGTGRLTGLSFLADEGETEAVILPALDTVSFQDGFVFTLTYCPLDDAPTAGWLLLSLSGEGEDAAVWAEELP